MVRIIVGFLLNVGIKKYKPTDVQLIFENKLKFSPAAVPSNGLFLY
jgi:tRNA U38,U39,U40 pseudouridine synthase TruA